MNLFTGRYEGEIHFEKKNMGVEKTPLLCVANELEKVRINDQIINLKATNKENIYSYSFGITFCRDLFPLNFLNLIINSNSDFFFERNHNFKKSLSEQQSFASKGQQNENL